MVFFSLANLPENSATVAGALAHERKSELRFKLVCSVSQSLQPPSVPKVFSIVKLLKTKAFAL